VTASLELVLVHGRRRAHYQMAAFLMAGTSGAVARGTFALTDAMIGAARRFDPRRRLGRKVVDKHSTGGVGDKTSLAVG
jgi:pyrimidine-nucleoside phosphorylase